MGSPKPQLKSGKPAARKPKRPCAPIPELYKQFCERLKDTSIDDPQQRRIFFRIENFSYLIKLEFFNKPQNRWVAAKSSLVIQALATGTFDESKHRCDPARANGLLRIREILRDPDSIHENIHARVKGKLVYVRKLGGANVPAKIAFVTWSRSGEWIPVTSFYTTDRWLKQCAKEPALYRK